MSKLSARIAELEKEINGFEVQLDNIRENEKPKLLKRPKEYLLNKVINIISSKEKELSGIKEGARLATEDILDLIEKEINQYYKDTVEYMILEDLKNKIKERVK